MSMPIQCIRFFPPSTPVVPTLLPVDIQELAAITVELAEYIWKSPEFPVIQPVPVTPLWGSDSNIWVGKTYGLSPSTGYSPYAPPSTWEILYHLCFTIIARAGITGPEVFIMLRFLRRLKKRVLPPLPTLGSPSPPTYTTAHPEPVTWTLPTAIIGAALLANKLLHDNVLSTKSWSSVLSMPVKELNGIEWRFAEAVEWELFVSGDEYWAWVMRLGELSARGLLSGRVGRVVQFAGRMVDWEADEQKKLYERWINPMPPPQSQPQTQQYCISTESHDLNSRRHPRPPRLHIPGPTAAASGSFSYSTSLNTPSRRPRSAHLTPVAMRTPLAARTPFTPINIPPAPTLTYANLITPVCGCTCASCVGAGIRQEWWYDGM